VPDSGLELTVSRDVTTGLQAPWSMALLPGAEQALVSERDSARILLLNLGDGTTELAGEVDGVVSDGEAGLMGLAVNSSGDRVFAMYTAEDGNRVVSMPFRNATLGKETDVVTGIPREWNHDGGRIAIGPDDLLYIATGDAAVPPNAQDLGSLAGKILRTTLQGDPAPDNPFPDAPLVYSYGHRNVQGLAFDEADRLWATEFGSSEYDELNLIVPGGNYGWPEVEGPGTGPDGDFIGPKAYWTPTAIASPSGLAIASGSAWVAALRGETLYEVPLSGDEAGQPKSWFQGQYGRLRDVVSDGEQTLYVMTSNTDGRGTPRSGDDRIIELSIR